MSETRPAVWVQDAYKRYTPAAVILRGLNMKVMEGTIYGLLGPSGCGKTTLLSCIVGQRQLDSGSIVLTVNNKAQVGFMPQEIALNGEFTISEVFQFYGRIYGMTPEKIKVRGNELIQFLEIPTSGRVINTCSGGQQRRISMAVTLLNNPKLLILDEPTVGVDPVLCRSIMDYFLHIVKNEGKTIIITTHYIEEARSSDCIGLMRGGSLLAEEKPMTLLQQYNCDSLEKVFLKLSEKQEKQNPSESVVYYPKIQPNSLPLKQEDNLNIERLKAQLIKNINWSRRYLSTTLFVICLPALLFNILGYLKPKNGGDFAIGYAALALVNFEADCLNKTSDLKLSPNCLATKPISCRFIDHLEEIYPIIKFKTEAEALKAVQKGRAFGTMVIPANFSQNLIERILEQTHASREALDGSIVSASFDMTDIGMAVRSMRELRQRITNIAKDLCEECGISRKIADLPVNIVDYVYTSEFLVLSLLPSFICSVKFYTVMMFTSTSIIMERNSGSYERSQVADAENASIMMGNAQKREEIKGLTMTEIIFAHVIIQFVIMIMQNILSFFVLYIVNSYPMNGSYSLAFLLIIFVQICGMAYGFLLSALITIEKNVVYVGIFTVLTLFLLTGSIWPIEGMHWLLKPFSTLIPTTMSSVAFYNITLRGWSLSEFYVFSGFLSSILGSIVFIVLIFLSIKYGYGNLS